MRLLAVVLSLFAGTLMVSAAIPEGMYVATYKVLRPKLQCMCVCRCKYLCVELLAHACTVQGCKMFLNEGADHVGAPIYLQNGLEACFPRKFF